MKKTAPFLLSLFTMGVLCSSVVAYAGQTPDRTTTSDTRIPTASTAHHVC